MAGCIVPLKIGLRWITVDTSSYILTHKPITYMLEEQPSAEHFNLVIVLTIILVNQYP